jgi:hypothetical protein
LSELNIALAVVSGLILVLGLLFGLVRRSFLSEPSLGDPSGRGTLGTGRLRVLYLASWGARETISEQAARLALAIGLMGWRPVVLRGRC